MSRPKSIHLLRHFTTTGVPEAALPVASIFYSVADELDALLPSCAEKTVAMRKLLEARDCALRVHNDLANDGRKP